MTELFFRLSAYNLQLKLENSAIHLQLTPSKTTSTPSYAYSAKLDSTSMDPKLNFIFNTISNLWKYITFHQEKSLSINEAQINKDNEILSQQNHLNPTSNKSLHLREVQLPISLCLILLPDVETYIRLTGRVSIDTLEEKFGKLLQDHQQLKEKLDVTLAHNHQLQKEIQMLRQKLMEIEEERTRLFQAELPRKRVHQSEDIEQGQYSLSKPEEIEPHLHNIRETAEQESKRNAEDDQAYLNLFENTSMTKPTEPTEPELTKIADFSQKCYMFVGFNERSEERRGFVCIGCGKAFKQVLFLQKHFQIKHSDLAQCSASTLGEKLLQFKTRKEEELRLENALKLYAAK